MQSDGCESFLISVRLDILKSCGTALSLHFLHQLMMPCWNQNRFDHGLSRPEMLDTVPLYSSLFLRQTDRVRRLGYVALQCCKLARLHECQEVCCLGLSLTYQ